MAYHFFIWFSFRDYFCWNDCVFVISHFQNCITNLKQFCNTALI